MTYKDKDKYKDLTYKDKDKDSTDKEKDEDLSYMTYKDLEELKANAISVQWRSQNFTLRGQSFPSPLSLPSFPLSLIHI